MELYAFRRFASIMTILSGISGFFYSLSHVLLKNVLLSSVFLALMGLLATAALFAVYLRVRQSEPAFALWALGLGIAGAVGAVIHGGYDLAYTVNNPPILPPVDALSVPSQTDPRGLLTFGFSGVAIFTLSWIIVRSGRLPVGLGYLGYLSGILLVGLYLARLIVQDPTNPVVLIPALLSGFVLNPIWFVWLGFALLQPVMVHSANYTGPERRVIERRHASL